MTNVVIVNPRAMYFGEQRATSIDLSVRDLILHSRFKATTTVIGDPIDKPFDQIAYVARPLGFSDSFYFRMRRLLPAIEKLRPDVVSVQEHLGTAGYLAQRLSVPVVLHVHNPIRKPKNIFERRTRSRAYSHLGGMFFVSSDHQRAFHDAWPAVTTPCFVVSNALDMTEWRPAAERDKVILIVGRAIPEKGIRETAQGLAATLPKHPDWKAIFILSAVEENKEYVASFQPALDALGQQAEVLTQQRFPVVKGWLEKAAIAIIPSIWKEPFGRTALEAHAGGAAVISSGAGGLREVSGDNAVYLDDVTPESIATATEQLLTNPHIRRDLASAGHNYVRERFDIHTTARACDQIYERLIAQKLTRTSS